jgi:hypothetical protein
MRLAPGIRHKPNTWATPNTTWFVPYQAILVAYFRLSYFVNNTELCFKTQLWYHSIYHGYPRGSQARLPGFGIPDDPPSCIYADLINVPGSTSANVRHLELQPQDQRLGSAGAYPGADRAAKGPRFVRRSQEKGTSFSS